ncbi:LysR family transcriptional regulator [Pseudoduganella sp. UC29_106]|uniref:LysR family transcriptional regulator n=1 Tax=Pseudoduganella sp. UC29_106 TaxID=3374553 RepID=UPI0037583C67
MDRLSAMETFVCVVETGSFSAAARMLKLGQPAVSKTVAQLEERLGVQLLLRSTRGLATTEAGQRFYEGARRTIDEANAADEAARGSGAGLSGRLTVSAAVTFARLHIVPRLPEFLAEHPGLSVDVVLDDRNIDLLENGIDIALRMGVLPDYTTMTARHLARGRRLALATPAWLEQHGTPQTPVELSALQAVVYERDGGGQWTFRKGDEAVDVVLDGRVRVTAAEGVREAVLAGLGLAVASEWMFTPELARGEVRAVLQEWELPPIDLWAVYPAGRKASAKARAFADFVAGLDMVCRERA